MCLTLTLSLLALAASLHAQHFFQRTVSLNLRRPLYQPDFTWSDQMEMTIDGLQTLQPWRPGTSRDFWFQTQPIAAGPAWRPPTFATIDLTLKDLVFDEASISNYIRVFARYSAERAHWSSWYPIPSTTRTMTSSTFHGELQLPRFARKQYDSLMGEWWQTNPVWGSDEREFCDWLVAHHRDYCANEIPFIGWVQLLVEGGAQGLRIGGISADIKASVGGMSISSRDGREPDDTTPWSFELSAN